MTWIREDKEDIKRKEEQLRKLRKPCTYRATRDRADLTRRLCDLEAKERRQAEKYQAAIEESQKGLVKREKKRNEGNKQQREQCTRRTHNKENK